MGRHRRSAAGRAATGRADHSPTSAAYSPYSEYSDSEYSAYAGNSAYPEHSEAYPGLGSGAYADASADAYEGYDGYSPAAPAARSESPRRGASHRRRRRASAPVRTGLLGVSAAVAMGAVAVASGLVPGGDNYSLDGGDDPGSIRSASSPSGLDVQGGDDGSAERGQATPSRGTGRADAPAPTPSESSGKPSAKPSDKPSATPPKPQPDTGDKAGKDSKDSKDERDGNPGNSRNADKGDKGADKEKPTPGPSRTESQQPKPQPPAEQPASDESAAEAEVLALVNQERAKAGCRPVRADAGLAALAGDFSADMAERGFFAHTDPDGATPWARAEKVGITDLGGENIARGQANAQSVMDAWMNSPGHRANILNCDYQTLGVGAHFAPGGPWWTQDFGF
ncbi:membrane protein [Streptomyces aureoverticillatus]|nr:membrane protein [Streptomyces aureoverticillatus]